MAEYARFLRALDVLLRDARIAPSVSLVWAGLGLEDVPEGDVPLRLRVGEIVDYIDEHPGDVTDLAFLSDQADRSPYHFARIFREETGTTPWAYVQKARLREARRLLEDTDLSLTEIALETGFYDQSHFTRAFKQEEGVTPGTYRKDLQAPEDAAA